MAMMAVPAAERAGGAIAARAAGRKAAGKAAGRKAAARRAPAGSRPNIADLAPSEVEQELQQRRRIAAAKARGETVDGETVDDVTPAVKETPAATSLGGGRIRPSGAGGGFVLGSFVYVLGLTYLRGGRPAVAAWLKAKFLNEVS